MCVGWEPIVTSQLRNWFNKDGKEKGEGERGGGKKLEKEYVSWKLSLQKLTNFKHVYYYYCHYHIHTFPCFPKNHTPKLTMFDLECAYIL